MRRTHREAADALRQSVRPLMITVISTLRPDLHPTAVGAAVERLVLECETRADPAGFWPEVGLILGELGADGDGCLPGRTGSGGSRSGENEDDK